MQSRELTISDLFNIVRKHLLAIAMIMGIVLAIFFLVTHLLMDKKYKSSFTVSIPSRYFQQPAAEDFLPSVSDAGELRNLRESILYRGLDLEYMETLRAKYGLFYPRETNPMGYEVKLQELQKQLEIVGVGNGTYQISFTGRDAKTTYEVTKDVEHHMIVRLSAERRKRLIELRNNLMGNIDSLGFGVNQAGDPLANTRPEVMRDSLQQVESILKTLRSQYTDAHPQVQKYLERSRVLKKWLKQHAAEEKVAKLGGKKTETSSADDEIELQVRQQSLAGLATGNLASNERYEDLLKRVTRLNIVLDFESKDTESIYSIVAKPAYPISALWPKPALTLLWGLLTGLLLSTLYVLFVTLKLEVGVQQQEQVNYAQKLGMTYLGEVPEFKIIASQNGPVGSHPLDRSE